MNNDSALLVEGEQILQELLSAPSAGALMNSLTELQDH